MGFLLPALTEKKFATQREVVINERRQNYENRPYGLAGIAMTTALYPPDHPYHWPTIGYTPDLRPATLDDVRDFFARHYHPGNASIALAGDIDPAAALALVERYFGDLPTGPPVPRVARAGRRPRPGETRHRARGSRRAAAALPRVADAGAVRGRRRRPRRRRRRARQRQDVAALSHARARAAPRARRLGAGSSRASSRACSSSPPPPRPAARSPTSTRSSTRRSASSPPTGPTDAELERALAQAEAHFVYRLQTVGGFSGKSDQLNAYNVYRGNPGSFDADLARYTPAHGRRRARRGRAGSPPDRARRAQRRAARRRRSGAGRLGHGGGVVSAPRAPAGGRRLARHPLPADRQAHARRRLAGLDGRAPRPAGRLPERALSDRQRRRSASIASASTSLTADLLDEGTQSLDGLALHDALARLGSHLEGEVGPDAAALGLVTLSRNGARATALLADVACHPRFDADRLRARPRQPRQPAGPDARRAGGGRRAHLQPAALRRASLRPLAGRASSRRCARRRSTTCGRFHEDVLLATTPTIMARRRRRRTRTSCAGSTRRGRCARRAAQPDAGAAACAGRALPRGPVAVARAPGRARRSRSCASAASPPRGRRPTTPRWR